MNELDQNGTQQSVLDRVIALSLKKRKLILVLSALLTAAGAYRSRNLNIDVFPDLDKPVVTVLAEAKGMAAEEVETQVSIPLESVLLGAPGVTGTRSSSKRGIAMIRAEFEWGTDIYRARQTVSERIDSVRSSLPENISPVLGPISSIMGEIMLIGVLPAEGSGMSLLEVRRFSQWNLKRRLLSIPGISNVTVMGGGVRSYTITVNSRKLASKNISFLELKDAVEGISGKSGGGFFEKDGMEYVFRNFGSVYDASEIRLANIGMFHGFPVKLGDVADVRIDSLPMRGDAGINGKKGVIVAVQKQPAASTIDLTEKIQALLSEMQQENKNVEIQGGLFRQADFIQRAVSNVLEAIRDGTVIVIIVLFLFLWNFRTTVITVAAIPLSLIGGILVLTAFGFGVNTMTLGGLAVAIGELVDDAVVDVENCYRRLKENRLRGSPENALVVVFRASSEIRNSIFLATVTVILVFLPLLFLDGVEGRLFQPLAAAYIVSILVSLGVALTVTPVLSYFLLPGLAFTEKESFLVRFLKGVQKKNLRRNLKKPLIPVAFASVLFAAALAFLPFLSRTFLPDFNEGTLTIELINPSGTGLSKSAETAAKIESFLLETEGVKRIARRTGRAEMDEHAEGVHYTEFDVTLDEDIIGEKRKSLIAELRKKFNSVEGIGYGIGQPISHRLDHLLSGVRSEVAVLISGHDLDALQYGAYSASEMLKTIPGVKDLRAEASRMVPEFKIVLNHEAASRYGLKIPEILETLKAAQRGEIVGAVREGASVTPVLVRLDEPSRSVENIGNLILRHLPDGTPVRLNSVAELYESRGPYEIQREDGVRRIAVQLNSGGRSLEGLVAEIEAVLAEKISLPEGIRYEISGRYRSAVASGRRILILGFLSFSMIAAMLYLHFRSAALAAQVLLNLPFSFIGGVFAVFAAGIPLSIASMVGFIALAGIASRNGILMISHFEHLIENEGLGFSEETVIQGALERMVPVLMTAGTAVLALLPVLLSGPDSPGKEILFPVAAVITGGLISSTFLDLMITPVIYFYIKRKIENRNEAGGKQ